MIFTPRCSGIEVISTKHNNLIENCQKKMGDHFIEKCQKFCKNNRNNLINDVNVKFIEYTEDQGKGKSKMESIYLRAQEKLEDLDFKNIIKLHRLGITIMMDVIFQLNLELLLIFFEKTCQIMMTESYVNY